MARKKKNPILSLSETFKSLPMNSMDKGLAWYTCGPTTYAPAHLGHARTYVCLDIVRRVLEHHLDQNQQPPPLFVMNITDVDDKILATSQETGEPPLDLGRRFERDFWRDLDALNCLRPHVVTRVSEHVLSDIVPYIQRLSDQGMAYEIDDGVYFDLRSFDEKLGKVTKYGKLAPPSIAENFFSVGNTNVSGHSNKKDLRDFVLWKKRKNGEALFWDSWQEPQRSWERARRSGAAAGTEWPDAWQERQPTFGMSASPRGAPLFASIWAWVSCPATP